MLFLAYRNKCCCLVENKLFFVEKNTSNVNFYTSSNYFDLSPSSLGFPRGFCNRINIIMRANVPLITGSTLFQQRSIISSTALCFNPVQSSTKPEKSRFQFQQAHVFAGTDA
jgi:hypothetical protein